MSASIASVQISESEMTRYIDLIYQVAGIRVSPQKRALLSNRLRRRLKATGEPSFDSYFKLLKKLKTTEPEWDAFLQEVTTHETYLFRDEAHWEWFEKEFLSDVMKEARQGKRKKHIRIWSAAASTGDEAFTAACCAARALGTSAGWKVEIVGTDIGVSALEEARAAKFGPRAMRLVSDDLKRRFFSPLPKDEWQAKPVLRDMITFQRHNLMEPLNCPPFDLVFLKNVLIYFDNASKQTVVGHIIDRIKPGGLLLSGAAEGVTELLKDLDRTQPWLHQKK